MRRFIRLNSLLLILLLASVPGAAAKELSPLEKALKALAEKKSSVQATPVPAGNTSTAQETFAAAGNTLTVVSARPISVSTPWLYISA